MTSGGTPSKYGYVILSVLAVNAFFSSPLGHASDRQESRRALNAPRAAGHYYQDVVPDTLDLAEQAGLGLNYFTALICDELNYEMYFGGDLTHFHNHITALGACQPKAMEAMCLERLMTGSKQGLREEETMLRLLTSFLGEDGLYWVSGDLEKKPWLKIPEPFAMIHGQGRMLRAMIAWYQYTNDAAWKERIDRLVSGLGKIAVHKDDYAYFPIFGHYEEEYLRSCYTHKGWKDKREPANEKDGEEGSLFNHQGHIPGALATWYVVSGNKQALDLSSRLVRFLTKPKLWDYLPNQHNDMVGAEHAVWVGHFHGHVNTLRAILEYALAVDDERLKLFVRDGYEWARKWSFARIGYVGDGQGCGCGRLIGLAIKLSEAGVGDYWEDVDQYIRNMGSRQQFQPEYLEFMKDIAVKQRPPEPSRDKTFENIPERLIGGFGGRPSMTVHWLCCGTHGNMGLFYAWDSTVRYKDGIARINLLLNRASPWLDIHSYLPYKGKVIVRNKTATEMYVRVPLWVDKNQVRCQVQDEDRKSVWFGKYLHVKALDKADVVTIEFPVKITAERWLVPLPGGRNQSWAVPGHGNLEDLPGRRKHICTFKGNTLVKMEPDIFPGTPIFDREYLLAEEPEMKEVTRYVSEQILKW